MSSNIIVKYFIPPSTDFTISVDKQRKVYLKVDEGSAVLLHDNGVPSQTELHVGKSEPMLLELSRTSLRCSGASVLTLEGLPVEVSAVSVSGDETRKLFEVKFEDEDYQFVLEKDTQLQILVGDEDSQVRFKPIAGCPETLGVSLTLNSEYLLPPHSSTLINTIADSQYAINIKGRNQIIHVLAREEKPLEFMRGKIVDDLISFRLQANVQEAIFSEKETGPVVLVAGPPNSGKTSLCHFLVNKAVANQSTPLYVDLEVRRNTNSLIPGTVSFGVVTKQRLLTGEMEGRKKILFFGSTNPYDNLSLYLQLIEEIGGQVTTLFNSNVDKTRNSGLIVDICGLVGTDPQVMAYVMKSMNIERVFVISDHQYYTNMKKAFGKSKVYFIEKSSCIEMKNDAKERMIRDRDLRLYFKGTPTTPKSTYLHEVGFDQVQIFSSDFEAHTEVKHRTLIDNTADLPLKTIDATTAVVNSVLAVVKRGIGKPIDLRKVIKYFVRLDGFDTEKRVYIFRSPLNEDVSGHILLMGKIKADFI